MVVYWDLMGFNGILMGIQGGFMGFDGIYLI
jgi:hypothetical protein